MNHDFDYEKCNNDACEEEIERTEVEKGATEEEKMTTQIR